MNTNVRLDGQSIVTKFDNLSIALFPATNYVTIQMHKKYID